MLGSMQTVSPAARRSGWLLAVGAAVVLLSMPLVSFTEQPRALADDSSGATSDATKQTARLKAPPEKEFLPPPTLREQEILDALEQPTTIEFHQAPLQDVVDFLRDKHEIEIQLDAKALEEAGMGQDSPVTAALKKVSLRSALGLLLKPLDLTWDIRNEVLLITTPEQADGVLFTRTYPVADMGDAPEFHRVVEAITSTVLPSSWDEVGGPGSIVVVPGSQSIVISQTRSAHDEVLSLLRSLRLARASQGPPPPKPSSEVKPKSAKKAKRGVGGGMGMM